MQTDNLGLEISSQTEFLTKNNEIQTLPIEYFEERKEFIDQVTQSDELNIFTQDAETEPIFQNPVKKDVSQYVSLRMPLTTSFTQTPPEVIKRTRTGGVQVCIGNRMHFRQLRLARLLNKLSIEHEKQEVAEKYQFINFFLTWK